MNEVGLTITEHDEFAALEQTIERGLQTFVEVGMALMAIREQRLYRADYGTFEDYCQQRWQLGRRHTHELIQAAIVVENVRHGAQILPENERQARPLTTLTPEQQLVAWQRAVDTAPNGKMTAAHVQSVVDEMLDPPPSLLPELFGRQKPKINRGEADEYTPQGFDACQTPAYAVDPLLPYLNRQWTIWEPARGEGNIVDALYDSGFESVLASDMLTGQNFFDYAPDQAWDCLVTNPPYSLKYRWLERCYALGKPFALLLPVETLGAKTAQTLFRSFGLEIIFLDKRVNFKMPNIGWEGSAAQFPTAWFTWGLNIGQQMTFAEVVRDD